jgi:hypothetical protein
VKLLEVRFTSPVAVGKKALGRALQIRRNLQDAVARTTLLGVTLVAMDTPVLTGRARANIAGEFGDMVDISGPGVNPAAVAEGRKTSPTHLDAANLEAVIGGNVEYLPPLEFGHAVVVKAVTGRRYHKRKGGKIQRVPGRAMFRKNIPVIRSYFLRTCSAAVTYGLRGEPLPPD